jgi:site-specific recombinase XerD
VKWDHWLRLYLERHCTARGLMPKTIAAYAATLAGFRGFAEFRLQRRGPDELAARDILEYVEYLRRERRNGPAAVCLQVTVLRNFYRAMVAMAQLDAEANPMAHFPRIKAAPTKLPVFLSEEETRALLAQPRSDTVLGIRDRALLTLLYGTGIRATECATILEEDVDLANGTVRVLGKGGRERVLPLNPTVARALGQYREARGKVMPRTPFFRSRRGSGLTRNAIYERVCAAARHARISKRVSPHRLRHTFATHLVQHGVQVVTIRDLLGHRSISSTQVYLHTTAEDLRKAAVLHPVERLVDRIADLLPNVKVPLQWRPGEKVIHRR